MRPELLVLFACAACQGLGSSRSGAGAADRVTTPSGRLVAHLERTPYDAARHAETCKVFHHVYAPDGRLLTKGQGGEFPHHRALFFGFNQTTWAGHRFDFWHMNRGETQRFVAFTVPAAGGDGWQSSAISWRTKDGDEVLHEVRAVRARDVDGTTTALDFASELTAGAEAVRLGGDPQHAGQQFRALQQFAEKDGAKVRYLRPPSATAHDNDVWTGCAWIAAVLPLADGPVTVLRLEHAANPGPVSWSTRDYGRFGAMFAADLPPRARLAGSWTYVIALGEKDLAWCAATAAREQAAEPATTPAPR